MGAAASKSARSAASASIRKYPTRTPASNPTTNAPAHPPAPAGQPTAPGPTVHPQKQASGNRDEAINLDASDPDFARSLRSLGPVQPSSTLSNSSTFSPSATPNENIFPNPALNPALTMLSRRSELAREAEAEFARVRYGGDSEEGRRFLEVIKIREILVMRDEKKLSEGEIERQLGLREGLVGRLGGKEVVREAGLGDLRGVGEL
ncbi:MAG: hypothetical protein LQ345_007481 [Seirophora villosa]|nr:MAG: hypothetical protein LQ345_007481 [Seirophora villosa]